MCWQPWEGSQFSVVHGLVSAHGLASGAVHRPPEQASPVVQLLLSLQAASLLVWTQPVVPSQLSSVQGLPSSQLGALPGTHTPAAHLSTSVQGLLSVQDSVLSVCTQPVAATHESVVHKMLSSQASALPGAHEPPAHWSPSVQALLSLQGSKLKACEQPLPAAQASIVHKLPSSQLRANAPPQTPPAQTSP